MPQFVITCRGRSHGKQTGPLELRTEGAWDALEPLTRGRGLPGPEGGPGGTWEQRPSASRLSGSDRLVTACVSLPRACSHLPNENTAQLPSSADPGCSSQLGRTTKPRVWLEHGCFRAPTSGAWPCSSQGATGLDVGRASEPGHEICLQGLRWDRWDRSGLSAMKSELLPLVAESCRVSGLLTVGGRTGPWGPPGCLERDPERLSRGPPNT